MNNFFFENASRIVYKGDIVSFSVYKKVRKYIGAKTLDVGAGSGAFLRILNEKGKDAIGLDLVENPECNIIKGDATCFKFDHKFDTVLSLDIVEHLSKDDFGKMVCCVSECLKQGGFWIINIPYNERLMDSICICPSCGSRFHRFGHQVSYNDKEILSIIQRYESFKVVKKIKTNFHLLEELGLLASIFYISGAYRIKRKYFEKDLLLVLQK
ncbi:class I SAM-dependent methyltransferase [Zooshikella sp. RANM57]|uniref:class I SAM-dependent methyltransferase n=1 Tax=Zooshikella sp. RANM57 TaxID=3425863 RepID=UPI003D6DE946